VTTPARRRAALTLHALSADDRTWMLERLDPGEREGLAALLDDLRNLGLPADTDLIRAAVADMGPPVPAPGGSPTVTLDAAGASMLEREPPWLTAVLLGHSDKSEQERVLQGWASERAAEVRRLMGTPLVTAPSLRRAAEAALAARLGRPAVPAPADLRVRRMEPRNATRFAPVQRLAAALGFGRA
jgi:hypothetical protein